jgi:hypothetical protein
MPRTFRDTLESDAKVLFQGGGVGYGETCTYIPVGGAPRTVDADVVETSDVLETDHGLKRVSRLEVSVRRHATEGIDSPRLGDGFKREDSDDVYSWNGTKTNVDQVAWTLHFVRDLPVEVGGNRIR